MSTTSSHPSHMAFDTHHHHPSSITPRPAQYFSSRSANTAAGTRALTPAPAATSPHYRRLTQSSLNETAYNGSEGHIDENVADACDFLEPPPAVVRPSLSPSRQAIGARFLSAVSNAQPAAAALGRKGSLLHSRAKSLAAYVPKLHTTALVPPVGERRESGANRILNDLFYGDSAPIKLGAPVSPTKEKDETEFIMEYRAVFTERSSMGPRRRNTAEGTKSIMSAAKPSTWFNRRSTLQPISAEEEFDEFASLNINTALFPNGPADPLDPAAFNDLLLNATSLLQRMQTAYLEKSESLAAVRPEMDAQREEVEEAETRSAHLKMQLENMCQRAQEQELTMKEMARQLADEKLNAQDARDQAARTVRLISQASDEGTADADGEEQGDASTPQRRRKRTSAGCASDSGFESDIDAASVFSGASSGSNETPLSQPSISFTPSVDQDGTPWVMSPTRIRDSTPSSTKVPLRKPFAIRTGSGSSASSSVGGGKRLGSEGAAWATVDVLRGENQDLKRQVEEMQNQLQACIDFVGGVTAV